METFKDFISKRLITKNGTLYSKWYLVNWGEFEPYKSKYKDLSLIECQQDIYNIIHDVDGPPKCSCGENLKFKNIKHGYVDACSLGLKCPVKREEMSKQKRKTSYTIDWFYTQFEKEEIDENYSEFEKIVEYFNNNQIRISKCRHLLNWISNYIKMGVNDWTKKMDRTIKSIENGSLDPKDSSSKDSFKIRYGKEFEYLAEKKSESVSYGSSLQKFVDECNGDYEKGLKLWEDLNLRKGKSLESYILRHGKEEGYRKYKDFWDNTTFAISEERFKNVYGDNWKYYFDKRKEVHKKAGELNGNFNFDFHECSPEEFKEWKKERYRKASENKKKDKVVDRLVKEGYTEEEIDEYIQFRWSHTSLESFIRKYGQEKGERKYKEYVDKISGPRKEQMKELYGEEEGERRYNELVEKTRNTKDNFIRKYGQEEGIRRYEDWYKQRLNVIKRVSKFSKESIKFWNELIIYLREHGILINNFYYGENEICVKKSNSNSGFFVDLYIEDYNIALEYNGVTFHPKESWSEEKKLNWKDPYKRFTFEEKLYYDNRKIDTLKSMFDAVFVYYNDEDKKSFFDKVVKYLDQRSSNVN